jgi:hypothetical protein
MDKPAKHRWIHGPMTHGTLDAICPCGVEQHDIRPTGKTQVVRYRLEPGAELVEHIPPCTESQTVKDAAP